MISIRTHRPWLDEEPPARRLRGGAIAVLLLLLAWPSKSISIESTLAPDGAADASIVPSKDGAPAACAEFLAHRRPLIGTTGRFSSGFEPLRRHPGTGLLEPHWGVDLAAPLGTAITAVRVGTVEAAGSQGDYGLRVVVRHQNGLKSLYAHMFSTSVGVGQRVKPGDTLGWVGQSGNATGSHVHFELLRYGTPFDPCDTEAY